MPRLHFRALVAAGSLCFCLFAQRGGPQNRAFGGPGFPPDVIQNDSVDVVKIAPNRYTIELENEHTRVLRARIPPMARVSIHGHRAGVLVALTEVHLRLVGPHGHIDEVHLPPGATRWLDASTHSEENLVYNPCEFLFIESKTSS